MKKLVLLLAVLIMVCFGCAVQGRVAGPEAIVPVLEVGAEGPPVSADVFYDGPFIIAGVPYWYYGGGFFIFEGGFYRYHHGCPVGERGFYHNHWRNGYSGHQQRFHGPSNPGHPGHPGVHNPPRPPIHRPPVYHPPVRHYNPPRRWGR